MLDKPVPYDLQAEAHLLGALVLDREIIRLIEPLLEPADFFQETHGWIYAAMCSLYARREPPDVGTVMSELRRRGQLELCGGLAYLSRLMHECPTMVHAEYYAASVADAAALRRLITTGGQIAALGYEEGTPIGDVLDRAERLLLAATAARGRRTTDGTDQDALLAYMEALDQRCQGQAKPAGIPTGMPRLDDLTRGARAGKLWIVTGESGGGKSTIQLALGMGWKRHGARVGLFSLEMDASELAERMLASRAGVSATLLDAGMLTPQERAATDRAFAELLEEPPMRLVTGGGLTPRDLTARAHRWIADGGLDVLIIDYLQLVRLPGRDAVRELDDFVNGLKSLAGELGCTIVAGAQLSRGAVGKDSRDWDDYLRGSQAIKHAADLVLACAPQGDRPVKSTDPWPILLSVTKHRSGPVGDVPALWWLALSKIGESTTRYGEGY